MDGQQIIDVALKQASKAGRAKKNWKKSDLARLNTTHAITLGFLNDYNSRASAELTDFEKHLIETMLDVKGKNTQIQHIKATIKILKKLKDEYEIKLKFADFPKQSAKIMKEYFGRYSSVVRKIKLDKIEKFLKKINELPKIKKMDTIIIAGYPNVGKSQLLKTMSKHKIQTAPYPFTTKELLIGYVANRYDKAQLIDTPGILDRPLEERNEIEKKAILALKFLSKNVLYLIDSSETCGYSIKEQENLLKEIKQKFKPNLLIIETKADLPHKKIKANYSLDTRNEKQVDELRKKVMKHYFG